MSVHCYWSNLEMIIIESQYIVKIVLFPSWLANIECTAYPLDWPPIEQVLVQCALWYSLVQCIVLQGCTLYFTDSCDGCY